MGFRIFFISSLLGLVLGRPFSVEVQAAEGGWVQNIGTWCAEVIPGYTVRLFKDLSREKQGVELKLAGTRAVPQPRIRLFPERRLGYGMRGQAYLLREHLPMIGLDPVLPLSAQERLVEAGFSPEGRRWVLKIGHLLNHRTTFDAVPLLADGLARELRLYHYIQPYLPAMKSDPGWPGEKAGWAPNTLPVPPIVASAHTTIGTILVKPFIRSLNLKDFFKVHRRHFVKKDSRRREILRDPKEVTLPAAVDVSLFHIYQLFQIIHRVVPVPEEDEGALSRVRDLLFGGGDGFSTDGKVDNLHWVDDPHELALLGFSRPGFVLIEWDQTPHHFPAFVEDPERGDSLLASPANEDSKNMTFQRYRLNYISGVLRFGAEVLAEEAHQRKNASPSEEGAFARALRLLKDQLLKNSDHTILQ